MFCYNCMHRIGDENSYCRHCGRNSYPDHTPHHIRPGSDLKGRYLVGNAVGEDGFSITYVARDLNIDERVMLKEYYPMGHVHRNSEESNAVTLNSEQEAAYFGKGSDAFVADARELKRTGKADVRDLFTENGTVYLVTALRSPFEPDPNAVRTGSDAYNDGFEGTAPEDYGSRTDIAKAAKQPKKKTSAGLIATIVICSVIVVAFAVTMIIIFANGNKSKNEQTASTALTTAVVTEPTTAEPTTKPEPTTESNLASMPDVRGKKLSDAESQLREMGLRVETTREYNDEVAKDYVLRQSIDPEQTLRKGDTVMLYVSDGAEPVPTTTAPKPTAPTTGSSGSSESSESRNFFRDLFGGDE